MAWMKFEITKVDGASITVSMTAHMSNGTEQTNETVFSVGSSEEGLAGVGWIIPADSKVNDTVSFGGTDMEIAQETTRTYGGVSRTVVGLSVSAGGVSSSIFWDKPTGILLETSMSYQDQSLGIVASDMNIGGGGGGSVGLGWWVWIVIVVVIVGAIGGVVFMLRRRKPPTTAIPPQLSPSPPPPPPPAP